MERYDRSDKDCNWLQHLENIVDPYHLMLRQWISGDQFEGALMQGRPTLGWEKTPLGVRYHPRPWQRRFGAARE
jgi:hypothetical protein